MRRQSPDRGMDKAPERQQTVTNRPTAMLSTNFTQRNSDATTPDRDEPDLLRLQELLQQVGQELAEPLTAALERVTALSTTGRIDRLGLKALREEVERARQAGIWCQQIARLASGRVRQSHERVHLTHTLQSVLAYRAREMHARGIQVVQSLEAVELQVDASMLYGLLNAMVEWWLQCAQGTIDVRVDLATWPADGRLHCRLRHKQDDDYHDGGAQQSTTPPLDNMAWRLLELVLWYAFVIGVGMALERAQGQTQPQRWEFYAVTAAMFLTLAFPGFVYRYLVRRGR